MMKIHILIDNYYNYYLNIDYLHYLKIIMVDYLLINLFDYFLYNKNILNYLLNILIL